LAAGAYGHTKYPGGTIAPGNRATIPGLVPSPSPEQYASQHFLELIDTGLLRRRKAAIATGEQQWGEEGEEVPGITSHFVRLSTQLGQILATLRGMNPTLQCYIEGSDTILQASGTASMFYFQIAGHRVPALRLTIQNQSAGTVFLGISEPASQFGMALAPNAIFNSDVVIDYVSLWATAALNVSNIRGIKQANAIMIQAWSNPEWMRVWGQI